MQEDQTVTFQPMEVYVPWYIGLFRLYLVFVILLAIFRFVRILWILRKQRVALHTESSATLFSPESLELSFIKARSFKTLSQLTLLIAVTVFVWSVSGDLMQVAMRRTSGVGALAGDFADALRNFSAGMIVSTALFSCSVFCERLIYPHRLGPKQKSVADEWPRIGEQPLRRASAPTSQVVRPDRRRTQSTPLYGKLRA